MVTLKELQTTNPFRSEEAPAALRAVANTDQARAVAEVRAALQVAQMSPRNPVTAMDRILNACTRPGLAERAIYQYPKGNVDITGPSIRLAEAVAQQWGNIAFGIRELEQSAGRSEVQAYAWDLESNTRREITFTVPHVRQTKVGVHALTDPRDIYEMVANQGARRMRSCILGVIPSDVIEAAVEQCEITLKAKAESSPETIAKMIEAFSTFGIGRQQIEARIQRRLDAITAAQVINLKKIYASLRDGMSSPADWFPDETSAADAATPTYRKKIYASTDAAPPTQASAPPAPAPAPAPEPTPAPTWPRQITDPETGEVGWQDASGAWYDERVHGWSAAEERPSVTSAGLFRARRGTSGAPRPAPEQQEARPATGELE